MNTVTKASHKVAEALNQRSIRSRVLPVMLNTGDSGPPSASPIENSVNALAMTVAVKTMDVHR